jgi:hypothetical protein
MARALSKRLNALYRYGRVDMWAKAKCHARSKPQHHRLHPDRLDRIDVLFLVHKEDG